MHNCNKLNSNKNIAFGEKKKNDGILFDANITFK